MSHTVVRMRLVRDDTGFNQVMPVIITEYGPLLPLVQYTVKRKSGYSPSYLNKLVQAVGLLLDFMEANHTCFDDPRALFNVFVDRLYSGTVGLDGDDPSGLYWQARSPQLVRQLVGQLSEFCDWMEEQKGAVSLNPWRKATRAEEQLSWAVWHHRKNRSFLQHTMGRDTARLQASRARAEVIRKAPVVENEAVKCFPEDRIEELLFQGFIVPGRQRRPRIEERLNLRDILITTLMHFGGLRMSEPFHLYVHDVIPDPLKPDSALVRVYHPSLGLAPDDWIGQNGRPMQCRRSHYLRGKWSLQPRTDYAPTTGMYAGWKGNALDSRANLMNVCWFPTWAGEFFWRIWVLYLTQRAQLKCGHPFAFVTADGRPHSIDSYKEGHRAAVRRIGMTPYKALGASPHSHRHAYGQRLSDAQIDPIYIKKAMHHRSLESQIPYTEPDRTRLLAVMSAAEESNNYDETSEVAPPDFLDHGFKDVDPLELLSGQSRLLQRRR